MSKMGDWNVLWVHQKMSTSKSSLKIEAGQQPSLCIKGSKHMLCVAAGHPVRVIKRDAPDFDRLRPVYYHGKAYTVERAVEQFNDIASRNGITQGARKLLERAANERGSTELDEDAFENEEELTVNSTNDSQTTSATADSATTKPKVEKKAKAAKPKAEKKAKVAKPKAEKKPAAKGDGLGREGSLTRFMNERLLKGQDNATISEAAKKAFPDSNTTDPSHVSWYRWNATKKGILKG